VVVVAVEPDPNSLENLVAPVQRVWTEEGLCAALRDTSLPIIVQNVELGKRLEFLHQLGLIAFVGWLLVRFWKPGLLGPHVNMRQIEENWQFKHVYDRVMLSPRDPSRIAAMRDG
jgi:hypothetical protein